MIIYEEIKNMKTFYEKIEYALQTLIDKYDNYFDTNKKDKVFVLNNLSIDLERISNLLNNYGFTYTPASMEDVSEDVFEVLVGRYLDNFKRYLEDGDSNLETINVDVKNLLTLVDKHKNIVEHFV